jgi:hypothetical protein
MVLSWLKKLTGGRSEPEAIPDINLVEADAYMGLRSNQRQPVQVGVDHCYAVRDGGGKERWLPITIVDLSTGGARIVSTEPVCAGDVLKLKFKLPKGAGEWHGTARITWASPSGLLGGIAFNPPGDKGETAASERLQRYVDSTKPQPSSVN